MPTMSRCPVCNERLPVAPKTRVTCLHLGTPMEKRYVSDIVTAVPLEVIDSTAVEEPLFEIERTRTHTRDDF